MLARIILLISLLTLFPKNSAIGQTTLDPESDEGQIFKPVANECLRPMDRADTCSFYRECLEKSISCESSKYPYAISYGEKYCNRFKDIRNEMSERGKQWLDGTRLCLQELILLIDGKTDTLALWTGNTLHQGFMYMSCYYVQKSEFKGHPICYLGGPSQFSKRTHPSICTLSPWDTIRIVTRLDISDAKGKESYEQMITVANACLNYLLGNKFSASANKLLLIEEDSDTRITSPDNTNLLRDIWTWKRESWINISQGKQAPPAPASIQSLVTTIEEEKIKDDWHPGFISNSSGKMFFTNGEGHYCSFFSWKHLLTANGNDAEAKKRKRPDSEFSEFTYDGPCQVSIPRGNFSAKDNPGIYQSNGTDSYCWITSPEFVNGVVKNYDFNIFSVTPMVNKGYCPIIVPQGFFNVKDVPGIYWSNGNDAYCWVPHPKYVSGPVREYTADIYSISSMRKDGACPGMI